MCEPIEQINCGKKLCLVVDDSPMIRKIARRFLSEFGLDVDDAENGKLGVEKCEKRLPDIVLLDWNMPVMNGIDFLRQLRQMPRGGFPTVIFCTTESDVSHISEAYSAGADDYLLKPFDRGSLWSKLSRFIEPLGSDQAQDSGGGPAEATCERTTHSNAVVVK